MPNVSKPGVGQVSIKKQGGSGPISSGTQINIPAARVQPSNPFNKSYLGVINASTNPSQNVLSKKTPGIVVSAYAKPYVPATPTGWFNADVLESLIACNPTYLDSNLDTDKWAVAPKDDRSSGTFGGFRVWDWSRCQSVVISGSGMGGPITVEMTFLSRWGETECPYGTTLPDGESAPSSTSLTTATTDAGQLPDVSKHDWSTSTLDRTSGNFLTISGALTADQVRSWRVTLMRGQGYVMYDDGTYYPKDISSGMFGGSLYLEQSPTATRIPSTSASISFNTDKTSTTGRFRMDMLLSLDSEPYDHDLGFGTVARTYSLIDISTGGKPITLTAF